MAAEDFVPPRGLEDDDLMWAEDFDPDTSPPDGAEAWLNDLPYEQREEHLVDPWTGAGEVVAAGFEHKAGRRSGSRSGRCGPGSFGPGQPESGRAGYGFAAGGVLDQLTPGPVLAGFVAEAMTGGADHSDGSDAAGSAGAVGSRDVSGGSGGAGAAECPDASDGLAGLSESELVGVLCASRRLASLAAAQEITTVIALARRRAAQARQLRNPHLIRHLADEVAAALTLTSRSADRLISLAAALDRLPAVLAALTAGIIDWPRAAVFADELTALDDADAQAIADRILARAGDLTTGQLRAALRREVLKVDPEAAERRRRAARKDAGVHLWDEASGNAAIAGRELPPAEVIAADQRITAHARWLKSHGAEGTMDQLRAAVFMALLAGRPVSGLLPRPAVRASADTDAFGCEDADVPDPDPAVAAITGTVNLTMPLASWLGMSEAPGEVPGFGALDAGSCRDLASWLAAHPATKWCVTLTDPNGGAVGHACARHGPGPPGTRIGPVRWLTGLRPCPPRIRRLHAPAADSRLPATPGDAAPDHHPPADLRSTRLPKARRQLRPGSRHPLRPGWPNM